MFLSLSSPAPSDESRSAKVARRVRFLSKKLDDGVALADLVFPLDGAHLSMDFVGPR